MPCLLCYCSRHWWGLTSSMRLLCGTLIWKERWIALREYREERQRCYLGWKVSLTLSDWIGWSYPPCYTGEREEIWLKSSNWSMGCTTSTVKSFSQEVKQQQEDISSSWKPRQSTRTWRDTASDSGQSISGTRCQKQWSMPPPSTRSKTVLINIGKTDNFCSSLANSSISPTRACKEEKL